MKELSKIKCPTCWETVRAEYDLSTDHKYMDTYYGTIECENCKQEISVMINDKTGEVFPEKVERIKNKFNDNTGVIEIKKFYPYMFYKENEPLEALNWINQYKKVIYFEFKQTGNLYFKIDYETLGLRDGNKITFNGEEFIIDNTPEEIKE